MPEINALTLPALNALTLEELNGLLMYLDHRGVVDSPSVSSCLSPINPQMRVLFGLVLLSTGLGI